MKYLKQFGIVMGFSFAGEILHEIIPLPVPASIYGFVLLLMALLTGILKLEAVKETGKFLVEIMPIMFIPAAVGLIDVWEIMAPKILAYIIIIVVSTVLVMAVSGKVTQFVIRREKKSFTGQRSADKRENPAAEGGRA